MADVALQIPVGQPFSLNVLANDASGDPAATIISATSILRVDVRVLQRLLALTAAIWHNRNSGQPVLRSLTAYDH